MKPCILIYGHENHYENYRAALRAAGADPIVSDAAQTPRHCHGLLLPGGGDILDGTLPQPESDLIAVFIAAGRPILGVCRGMQALNVYFGGTLHPYIPHHQLPHGDMVHPTCACAPVAPLLGNTPTVNSNHHQAIHRLGAHLRACQWAHDGVIEGIFHTTYPLLGVQWHPERQSFALRRPDADDAAPLLRRFVEMSENSAKENSGENT